MKICRTKLFKGGGDLANKCKCERLLRKLICRAKSTEHNFFLNKKCAAKICGTRNSKVVETTQLKGKCKNVTGNKKCGIKSVKQECRTKSGRDAVDTNISTK